MSVYFIQIFSFIAQHTQHNQSNTVSLHLSVRWQCVSDDSRASCCTADMIPHKKCGALLEPLGTMLKSKFDMCNAPSSRCRANIILAGHGPRRMWCWWIVILHPARTTMMVLLLLIVLLIVWRR